MHENSFSDVLLIVMEHAVSDDWVSPGMRFTSFSIIIIFVLIKSLSDIKYHALWMGHFPLWKDETAPIRINMLHRGMRAICQDAFVLMGVCHSLQGIVQTETLLF